MMQNHDLETIVAQCTPIGKGAIALIRVSGIDSVDIVSRVSLLPGKKSLMALPSHSIHYGTIVDTEHRLIDQVMFFLMRAPKTFTGQDTVEITCHNNQFIVQAIIDRLVFVGARMAQEGEFSKRAVLNGKMDLLQAESINELIHAHTMQGLKKTLAQLEGSFSHAIAQIEHAILKAMALCEASFEFIDEEMTFDAQISGIVATTLGSIADIKRSFDQQQRIRDGIRIALIGSVNTGKSSLFNALLHKKRSIVTSIAGTTRDAIEAGMYRNDQYWTLIDTAGLRETDDVIEQEGIGISFRHAACSDVILLILDGARVVSDKEQVVIDELYSTYNDKIITVCNKSDLLSEFERKSKNILFVSTKTEENIDLLEKKIEEKVAELCAQANAPFLLNMRQFNVLSSLEKKLMIVQAMVSREIAYELVSCHLNDALACLSELTGKTVSEQVLNTIFKEFCIGK
ncbi:MAG TPA: tRNA uridine-5-carboxymethylaminomethyl(34) synthesis GTPase MnmE [Candidatus Babeliales bacterium]|nr:tRNA uridine-5-carboxymethylaminomethyl(34) synthesis GTPase MnmE [Candidatus Babeliales bacterium]